MGIPKGRFAPSALGPLLPVRFGNVDPPHRLRTVRLPFQGLRQFTQPPLDAERLDVREILAVHARCPAVAASQPVSKIQNVAAIHLVVQRVEAIVGRSLRFGMQRVLKLLNTFRSL